MKMKKTFNRIRHALSWIIFSKWYKGGDMGDGILVSLLSGFFFICIGIALVIVMILS